MKKIFNVFVIIYMFYRTVYSAKVQSNIISVEPLNYGKSQFWKVGSNQTVTCNIPKTIEEVEWRDPSGKVVPQNSSNRIFARKNNVPARRGRIPTLVLNLRNVTADDSGVYQCSAGKSSANAHVCVMAPLEFVDTPTEVTVDVGRSYTLTCQAKGTPEPRIVWTINTKEIYDEPSEAKYRVMTKYNIEGFEGLLTITSLVPEDSGVYSCIAIQEAPHASDCSHHEIMNITLQVNHAPIFEDANDTEQVFSEINQSVELECSASGYPAPTYRWFRDDGNDGLFEFNDKHIKLNEDENMTVLTVTADATTYGKMYKCQASNTYGDADKYYVLLKLETPTTPSEMVFHNSNEKQIQFNVSWSDKVLFPIDGFDIQYFEIKDAKKETLNPKITDWRIVKKVHTKIGKDDDAGLELKEILVTLSDLEEETGYWVRLRATNNAGESPWSNWIKGSTTSKLEEVTEAETEIPTKATIVKADVNNSDATFYGIFFAGGILVVAAVCMFAMRMV